jgi:hypothetical protein
VLTAGWLYKDQRSGSPLRPNAWLPHPRVELSVFRIDGWSEEEILKQGDHVAAEREENHRAAIIAQGKEYPPDKITFRNLGRGEIHAGHVRSTGLDVVPREPPPRHADIIGWPPITGNRKQDEAAQMVRALRLVERASYVPAI